MTLTLTASWVIESVVVKSPAETKLIKAFVVVCCTIRGTHWILIGRTVFVTHTASFMCTVGFTDTKRFTDYAQTWIQVLKREEKNI